MINRLFIILNFLFFAVICNAQEAGSSSTNSGVLDFFYENIILLMGIVVVVAAFAAIIFLFNMMLQIQKNRLMEEQGVDFVESKEVAKKESWLSNFYKNITGTRPIEEEEDILFDHEYDGIRELDNSLPPWWTALFYVTIIFAVVYIGYYHFTDYGLDPHQEYAQEMEIAEKAKLAFLATQSNLVDETNAEFVEDDAFIAAGKTIYDKNCVACHGALGEGNVIGPNMTDEYWIHGGGMKNIFKTVKYGVIEKGMQAWQEMLSPVAIHQVSSYIMTLEGTNPPNAKEPQGEIWKESEEN